MYISGKLYVHVYVQHVRVCVSGSWIPLMSHVTEFTQLAICNYKIGTNFLKFSVAMLCSGSILPVDMNNLDSLAKANSSL